METDRGLSRYAEEVEGLHLFDNILDMVNESRMKAKNFKICL